MEVCPIAPPKGFPNVYGACLAHRPFGNLRAKPFRFLKASNSVCSSISRHLNNANLHEKTLFVRLLNNHLILIWKVKGTQFPCGVWGKAPSFSPIAKQRYHSSGSAALPERPASRCRRNAQSVLFQDDPRLLRRQTPPQSHRSARGSNRTCPAKQVRTFLLLYRHKKVTV